MPVEAKVYRVLIASPGDVIEEREIIREEVHRWNAMNAVDMKIILMPIGWETDATPDLREPGQVINKLYLTESVKTVVDQSVKVQISSVDSAQEAGLRSLHPEQHYSKKQIHYAYKNEAAKMQVESVLPESIKGKTAFVLTLKPYSQAQGNNMIEFNFNGYSADKIAELRARFLLLNELPPNRQNSNDDYIIHHIKNGYDNCIKVEKCVFINLWATLKNDPQLFLNHARLTAVYHLKMSCIVEHILELKLTLLKNNILSVQFRGQRKQSYGNPEPVVIEVKGNCDLNA